MNRKPLLALLLVAPLLLIVRVVLRYRADTAAMERTFGTAEEQRAATDRIISSQHEAADAGATIGAQLTQQGCVDEGFARQRADAFGYSQLMHFLEGCLRSANKTPGFCDGVPKYRASLGDEDELRSQGYQDALCQKYGFEDVECRASVRMIQVHCHPLAP